SHVACHPVCRRRAPHSAAPPTDCRESRSLTAPAAGPSLAPTEAKRVWPAEAERPQRAETHSRASLPAYFFPFWLEEPVRSLSEQEIFKHSLTALWKALSWATNCWNSMPSYGKYTSRTLAVTCSSNWVPWRSAASLISWVK